MLIRSVFAVTAVGVLVACSACRGGTSDTARVAPKRNILLVTIDTLRADRLGRGLTPVLDGLAKIGVSFTTVRTVAPLTLPAHVSIMTGVYPAQHGAQLNGMAGWDVARPTLAKQAQAHGYRTAAFVGAYVLDRRFGLSNGFETYDDQIQRDPSAQNRLEAERDGDLVIDRAVAWLESVAKPSSGQTRPPFFLWVHLYDPHAPYDPPRSYLEKANGQAYDGEVAFADAQVGRLIESLRATNMDRDTVMLVVGDHGESLGDHGEHTHGMLLYESALRVPLIVMAPGLAASRRDNPASLVDVAPTVLALAGLPALEGSVGANLLDEGLAADRETESETEYPSAAGWSPLKALADRRWKLIDAPAPELYDLMQDPEERRNIASDHERVVRGMQETLAQRRRGVDDRAATPNVSPEVAERLRALGYVSGPSGVSRDGMMGPNPAEVIDAWNSMEHALALQADSRKPEGLTILRGLSRAHPDGFVFQSTYARALLDAGQAAAAAAVYREIVKKWPADAMAYQDLAVAAREAGYTQEALKATEAALAIDSSNPAALNGLGLLQIEAGRFAAARSAFERAVTADPTNASYWVNVGNAARELGDLAGAEKAYTSALTFDPKSADAENGVGVLLVQAGRPSDAVAHFERALLLSPSFHEARLNLGIALQQSGRLAEARDVYRAVLAAPPAFKREREAAATLLQGLRD